jgi:hypothetical protein
MGPSERVAKLEGSRGQTQVKDAITYRTEKTEAGDYQVTRFQVMGGVQSHFAVAWFESEQEAEMLARKLIENIREGDKREKVGGIYLDPVEEPR